MSVEPTTASAKGVLALAVLIFGTAAGEYAAIVFAALAGSLWALSKIETPTRRNAALLMLRLVMTAVVLTSPVAWYLEAEHRWPAHHMLAPVAFFIGALGDRWPTVVGELWDRLRGRFGGPAQ